MEHRKATEEVNGTKSLFKKIKKVTKCLDTLVRKSKEGKHYQ
jgi:hypothetical protein